MFDGRRGSFHSRFVRDRATLLDRPVGETPALPEADLASLHPLLQAYVRRPVPSDRHASATCESTRCADAELIDLELLFSAPTKKLYRQLADALEGMPRVPVNEAVFDRALGVQSLLAEKSQHRAVPLPDLLVAACAEINGLIVLHYDADYERIAKITAQPTQWVVPRGSVS